MPSETNGPNEKSGKNLGGVSLWPGFEWSPRNYIGGVLLACVALVVGWTALAAARPSQPDFKCDEQRQRDTEKSGVILGDFLVAKREVRQTELAAIGVALEATKKQLADLRDPAEAAFQEVVVKTEEIAVEAEKAATAATTAANLSATIAAETRAASTSGDGEPAPGSSSTPAESDGEADDRSDDDAGEADEQTTLTTARQDVFRASDVTALTEATAEATASAKIASDKMNGLATDLATKSSSETDERAKDRLQELKKRADTDKLVLVEAKTATETASAKVGTFTGSAGQPVSPSLDELLPLAQAAASSTKTAADAARALADAAADAARQTAIDQVAKASTSSEKATAQDAATAYQERFQASEAEKTRLEADERRIQDDLGRIDRAIERATVAAERGEDSEPRYRAPRSSATLEVQSGEVAEISLGSARSPHRVEIVLLPSAAPSSEGATPLKTAEGAEAEGTAELPDQPTFAVSAGQFRRGSSLEIDPTAIEVWARRIAQRIVVSVCITPDDGLDAGRYAGTVSLVDPSMNSVHVPVEIKAQSPLINNLYAVLFLAPALAFGFIWVTGRQTAYADPLDREDFLTWSGENLLLCFGVGIAAVWATLQVPFGDPTWGSSVPGSAALVGVSIVAAITAMTAVAGKTRFDEQKKSDASGSDRVDG